MTENATPDAELDEHALVRRTQRGEAQAFNPLVTKYQSKIYSLIYGQVQSRETAQDLTQETWIKAWKKLPTFRGDSAFYTWLYQIAQNVCIDYHRKQNTRAKTFSTQEVDDTLIGKDTHPSPCQLLEKKELRLILRKAIQQL